MTDSSSKTIPKVVILAAGEGTRLRPHTLDRPKCLVEINGRSLLARHLDVLHKVGLTDLVLVAGYLADKMPDVGLRLYRNPRYAETNMVHTLFCAEAELEGEVVIAYGDIVYSPTVILALLAAPGDVAVVVDKQWEGYWRQRFANPLDDAETLKLGEQGEILGIGQKPGSLADIEGQYIGLMKFSPAGLAALKAIYALALQAGKLAGKPVEKAYMTDILQALINSGQRLDAVPVDGGWVEVDSVDDFNLEATRTRLAAITQQTDAL